MKYTKQDDLLAVLLALEQRIMDKLQVATLAIVTDVNAKQCTVKPFPVDEINQTNEIQCSYPIDMTLTKGSIVVVLFANKDFRSNLQLFDLNLRQSTILPAKTTHDERNGIVISILRKQEETI